MSIDYERQFRSLTVSDILEEEDRWEREQVYLNAKEAYESARWFEACGVAVALAKGPDGNYFVWTGERGTA